MRASHLRLRSILIRLLDTLLLLAQNKLDVRGARHVRVDTTMSTVCAAALALGTVGLDVADVERVDVKTLDLKGRPDGDCLPNCREPPHKKDSMISSEISAKTNGNGPGSARQDE